LEWETLPESPPDASSTLFYVNTIITAMKRE
jgi:hypothetical protein